MARFYVDRYTAKIEQTDRYLVRLVKKDGAVTVRIGGSAVMSLDCELKL